jgi:hypothetical protein
MHHIRRVYSAPAIAQMAYHQGHSVIEQTCAQSVTA